MDPFFTKLMELILFFIIFPVTFKAMMSVDLAKHFQKGAIWQIQIITIFLSLALSYLVTRTFAWLIELSTGLIN